MLRSVLASILLFVSLIAVLIGAAAVTQQPEPLGEYVLLTSRDSRDVSLVDAAVKRFEATGFSVTSNSDNVLAALTAEDSGVMVLTVTREAFDELPAQIYQDLYGRGVVIVGLDIAMRELMPSVLGLEGGTSMLPYDPTPPVFSMLRANCGGSGRTSDWLPDSSGLAELAISRSRSRCEP